MQQHRITLGFWNSLYRQTLLQKNYERCIKNVDEFRRGQLDDEEEENSKTFLFPVEEIQTVFNGNRTRLNIFIIIITLIYYLILFCQQGAYDRSLWNSNIFVFLDIDECSTSSPVCDSNANCSNTRGSYICTCKAGYYGDGKTCGGRRK